MDFTFIIIYSAAQCIVPNTNVVISAIKYYYRKKIEKKITMRVRRNNTKNIDLYVETWKYIRTFFSMLATNYYYYYKILDIYTTGLLTSYIIYTTDIKLYI